MRSWTVDDEAGARLVRYARACIAQALGGPVAMRPGGGALDALGASFVTLHRGDELHGCIGSLEPNRNLADDVHKNALAAAFEDPRARPLDLPGLSRLSVEVSVLSPHERLPRASPSEEDTVAALRPGVDGLILRWGGYRGTFLPQVWESLPEPADFLRHLKHKAGLRIEFWAPDIQIERYTVQKFKES